MNVKGTETENPRGPYGRPFSITLVGMGQHSNSFLTPERN